MKPSCLLAALVVEDQGDTAETLCKVELGEVVLASPAVAAGRLIVRSERTLFCCEQEGK